MPRPSRPHLPAKSEVFEYWKDRIFDLGFDFFIDWGEPTCWACGEMWNGKYDIKHSEVPYEELLRGWDRAPLQRRHIISIDLGGSDEPSNLFLVCKECYDLAPNTSFPEIFFQWAQKQNFMERHAYHGKRCRKTFGIPDEMFPLLKELLDSKEFRECLGKHASWHSPLSGYERYRGITLSTMYGLLAYYCKQHRLLPVQEQEGEQS